MLACSYRAECVAMEVGLRMLWDTLPKVRKRKRLKVAVFTDSLSLLMALETGPVNAGEGILRRIWRRILRLMRRKHVHFSFQFIFAHTEIAMHDAVDDLAKKGRKFNSQNVPAWITDIVTSIKRVRVRPALALMSQPQTHRQKMTEGSAPHAANARLTRSGEVMLAQFRCGSSTKFGIFQRILEHSTEAECRWCKEAAEKAPASKRPRSPRATLEVVGEKAAEDEDAVSVLSEGASSTSTVRHIVKAIDQATQPPQTAASPSPPRKQKRTGTTPAEEVQASSPTVKDQAEPPEQPAPFCRAARTEQRVFCPECYSVFSCRSSLVKHLKTMHDVPAKSANHRARSSLAAPQENGEVMRCPFCIHKSDDLQAFKEHMLE
ncbi:hypothetical protein STCU_06601 [Strigomonas culicis]|uniref:C2H2-type domain-containing protein n=1 Tax=Strigomonas culicis TaxID=28005 RepID=S9U4G1_9TRYP|nr:hypothetical protein STCU_06601 [Strigomonas culicis]|eukprot:EPY25642.1 hypothetical protein STCU_06601 [Strigomonas culicis]